MTTNIDNVLAALTALRKGVSLEVALGVLKEAGNVTSLLHLDPSKYDDVISAARFWLEAYS